MDGARIWIIGTDASCDVRVNDEYASARHCMVVQAPLNSFLISDLGSTNGTRIRRPDGTIVRVTRLIPMSPGDTLIVGRSELPWRKP